MFYQTLDVFDFLDVVHPVDFSPFIYTLKFDIRVHRNSCFKQLHLCLFVSKGYSTWDEMSTTLSCNCAHRKSVNSGKIKREEAVMKKSKRSLCKSPAVLHCYLHN